MKKILFPLLIVISALVGPLVANAAAAGSYSGNDEKVFCIDNSTVISTPSDDNGYRVLEEFTEDDETNHSDDDTGHFDNASNYSGTIVHHNYFSLYKYAFNSNKPVASVPVFILCRVLRL